MKKLLALLSVCTVLSTQAQPPRRDTAWGNFPNQPYLNGILNAPVVTGETVQIVVHPNREPFCFDKKITVKGTANSRLFEQCLYLDTKGGLVGSLPPVTTGGGAMCDIKPDEEKFNFSVIGLKGNVYIYRNQKKKGRLEHYVSSGNSQTYLYQTTGGPGSYTLHKKLERRDYCGGSIKAHNYKYDGANAPNIFIFGKTYPQDINVSSNKYIGNLGIGYQYTDKGLYIVMEMLGSGYECKITSIEEVNVCFDPTPFQLMEDVFVEKQTESLDKMEEKIQREEQKANNATECQAEKKALVDFKKEMLRKQKENLQRSQQGNAYQDPNTQKAYANMMDPLHSIQQGILDTKLSICNLQQRLQRSNSSSNTTSIQEKINCKNQQLTRLISVEGQMKAIDARYPNNPGQAHAEKSRLGFQAMTSNNCN